MKSKVVIIWALNQPLIQGDFDLELSKFKLRMHSQMINVLTPFLAFSNLYINVKAHDMMIIMLDFCFLNMKVIKDYVGHIVDVIAKYDTKVMYPLLLQVYLQFNLVNETKNPTTLEDDEYFFGYIVFIDDTIM